jgi:hypothetical protein
MAFLDERATARQQLAIARAMPDWLDWWLSTFEPGAAAWRGAGGQAWG